jgi:putative membrane protein
MRISLNFYQGLVLISFLFSCNNGSTDSVKNAKDSNAAKIDSQRIVTDRSSDSLVVVTPKADADFLVNAASGGMMEVQLGQLAQTNSRNQRVMAFGAMMVRDHGKGGEKLKTLAAAKNVTLPTAVSNHQQKEIESLQKKTGNDFDRAYISSMFSDHKDDIKEFEKEAKKGADPQIMAFANSNLDMLHRHLDSADNLQKLLGINDRKDLPPVTK